MIETKLAFKGDYAREFGGRSRIWRVFSVFKDNIEVGSLYVEPEDYPQRYHVYQNGYETTGDRIGSWYASRKEALKALAAADYKGGKRE